MLCLYLYYEDYQQPSIKPSGLPSPPICHIQLGSWAGCCVSTFITKTTSILASSLVDCRHHQYATYNSVAGLDVVSPPLLRRLPAA
ncbi:hypothetical protein RRG08_061553 [Elysia crispata]|uniref:Uncharacterized protein n=1 Tax=Elysia crispata TaxID=231223 RepID=A0AAE0YU25_9GAST|nr:hypothetical protein RRG08_061553 [Elysia crispata]